MVGGGGAGGEAAFGDGVEVGEEPEDPGGADEEEGGCREPRLRYARSADVDDEEDPAGGDAQEEHGEDQRHPHVPFLLLLHRSLSLSTHAPTAASTDSDSLSTRLFLPLDASDSDLCMFKA